MSDTAMTPEQIAAIAARTPEQTDWAQQLTKRLFDECGLTEDLSDLSDLAACENAFIEAFRQVKADALIESQAERIKALEAGLDPFAFAARFTGNDDDSCHVGYSITSGDLRRAASLLEGKK